MGIKRKTERKKEKEKKRGEVDKKTSPSKLSMHKLLPGEFTKNWHCHPTKRAQQWRAWHKTTRRVLFPLSFPRALPEDSCHSEHTHSFPSFLPSLAAAAAAAATHRRARPRSLPSPAEPAHSTLAPGGIYEMQVLSTLISKRSLQVLPQLSNKLPLSPLTYF